MYRLPNNAAGRRIAVSAWQHIQRHELMTRASAISFSAMMAAVPLIALFATACVYLLPDLTGSGERGIGNLTADQLRASLRAVFPDTASKVVWEQIARLQASPPLGLISITLTVTLWTSGTLFVDIIDALNRIYGVTETRPYWRVRLTATAIAIAQSLVFVVAMLLVLLRPQLKLVMGNSTLGHGSFHLANWVMMLALLIASFALVLRLGPDSALRRHWVTPGALFGALVLMATTFLLREYLDNFTNYDKLYGSLGGVMALMMWFWLASVVLLVAAEMNRLVAEGVRNQ